LPSAFAKGGVTVAGPLPILTGFPWHLNMRKNKRKINLKKSRAQGIYGSPVRSFEKVIDLC
jgi:hypothetical protein